MGLVGGWYVQQAGNDPVIFGRAAGFLPAAKGMNAKKSGERDNN